LRAASPSISNPPIQATTMTRSDNDALPPFEPHVLTLESLEASKITSVAVYSRRAEVTRLFRFAVKQGQNQVVISGLPNAMYRDSLRVDGRGAGTIQDVSVSSIETSTDEVTSAKLKGLRRELRVLQQADHRAAQKAAGLDKFVASLLAGPSAADTPAASQRHTASAQLKQLLADYSANMQEAQGDALDIQDQMQDVRDAIKAEEKALEGKKRKAELHMKVTVSILADAPGDVEIALVYAVDDASWTPRYDIRVNTQTASKEKTITLVYKGAITQTTGEDWKDVSIILETAEPTFDNSIPHLHPWTVSVDTGIPPPRTMSAYHRGAPQVMMMSSMSMPAPVMELSAGYAAPSPPMMKRMEVRGAQVTSNTGSVSATFAVPGRMSVPSDTSEHSVTITDLTLEAKMRWVAVPKREAKVHLSAKIKNTSEFLLLAGQASVYVDGSFISRSDVPDVSPDETFDCPLGLDPAIKVTYHPQTRKLAQTGLLSKTDVYTFTQRIGLHNTKPIAVENVRVLDQIHVSEDAAIGVKLLAPTLPLPPPAPAAAASGSDNGSVRGGRGGGFGFSSMPKASVPASPAPEQKKAARVPPPVQVAQGVVAQWDYDDTPEEEENVDVAALGKDGKIAFVCALPAQGKANLTVQWEVTAPAKTKLVGL